MSILTEMYDILGHLKLPERPSDPTPREVTGVFLMRGPEMLAGYDSEILSDLAQMEWEHISHIALLAELGPERVVELAKLAVEDAAEFRRQWAESKESVADSLLERSMFVGLAKAVPQYENIVKYVTWAVTLLGEAGEATKNKLYEKSSKLKMIIPAGDAKKRGQEMKATEKYMTPHTMDGDRPRDGNKVMDNGVFKDKEIKPSGPDTKTVVKAEKMMKKAAAAVGKEVDQAFPNMFTALQREKIKVSKE